MFLAALLTGWTLIGLLAGSVVCLISTVSLSIKTVVLFCSAGYTGLISDSLEVSFISIEKNTPRKESSINAPLSTRNQKAASCLL